MKLVVATNNFELKPAFIQMVQHIVYFDGLQDDDPNAHISNFVEVCDMLKINDIFDNAIRPHLFLLLMNGQAKNWLSAFPLGISHNIELDGRSIPCEILSSSQDC